MMLINILHTHEMVASILFVASLLLIRATVDYLYNLIEIIYQQTQLLFVLILKPYRCALESKTETI